MLWIWVTWRLWKTSHQSKAGDDPCPLICRVVHLHIITWSANDQWTSFWELIHQLAKHQFKDQAHHRTLISAKETVAKYLQQRQTTNTIVEIEWRGVLHEAVRAQDGQSIITISNYVHMYNQHNSQSWMIHWATLQDSDKCQFSPIKQWFH